MIEGSVSLGSPLGASSGPGYGWRRLTWAELARRIGLDLFSEARFPSFRSFPYESWPASIRPPAEGSLDAEQFVGLVKQIERWSARGPETDCVWRYSAILHDEPYAFRGPLREGAGLYIDGMRGSPNNLWPIELSCFVWTDVDLSATKVSGSRDLVDVLLADPDVEAVETEFGDWPA